MNRPSEARSDHSGVVIPPPLIYLAFFLVGMGLQRYAPLPHFSIAAGRVLGAMLVLSWLVLTIWSFKRFWAVGTSVIPVRPTTALVIHGPYRFTRNPMYLGMLLLYLGVVCGFGLVWPLILVPGLVLLIDLYVIAREERYLQQKFGQDYRQYQARVRRWV